MGNERKNKKMLSLTLGIICIPVGIVLIWLEVVGTRDYGSDEFTVLFILGGIFMIGLGIFNLTRFFIAMGKQLVLVKKGTEDMAVLEEITPQKRLLFLHYDYHDKDGIWRRGTNVCPLDSRFKPIVRMLKKVPIIHNGELSALREEIFLDMIEKAKTAVDDMEEIALLDPANYASCTQCAAKVKLDTAGKGACEYCSAQMITRNLGER